ncbi:glycosyl hydrolase family 76-domain-containing protein [Diplogelasinospora grovesii]|uniref:Mannan endo-1,6-alpha-mannosidase n=1 Tax=Diplogelasinospora grovesii TaxID=303347 RepID=A0AAN6N5W9_9PEZI|nr:glycosyl hydrolase family 76-domain-containing protein [Diplogelasinospora grovesii]
MKFYKSSHPAVAAGAGAAIIAAGLPKDLNIASPSSIQSVAKTLAMGTMSYYSGTPTAFVDLPKPYYWWECGAMVGSMLDYSHYTGDHSYDPTLATALLAQVGPNFDYMLPAHYGDEGNDDQAFWGFAVLAAAERNFPQPNASIPDYLTLGENLWNSMAGRWNTSACGGGLLWQIFASNPNGLDYKNSVSNGGLFQLSARLARATGNQTYLDWAAKVWDWTTGVGMIDSDYVVLDGASAHDNCSAMNQVSFSYSTGIYLYGAAVMANVTSDPVWADRTEKLLDAAKSSFFGPFDNATDIMYEHACEQAGTCNNDMKSFKGYLSRFMYAATLYVPSIQATVNTLLGTSAQAAANACTGGADGTTCGQKWYVGGFDGSVGLGQEMCALETVQGLLVGQSTPPYKGDQIKVVREFAQTATSTAQPTATATAQPTKRSNSAASLGNNAAGMMGWLVVLASLLAL